MKEIQLTKQLPVINMNYEEVRNSLEATISKYKGLVVTEEALKDCKATQKELSKIKTTLDKYRIAIKKEMLVPVTAFEKQCKELVGMVADAEVPIKEGILIFDNQTRQKKAEWAETVLEDTILKYNLQEEYRKQIDISHITINLSNSKKSIEEEIETKVKTLAVAQQLEEDRKNNCYEVIKATLETVNPTLTIPFIAEDFNKFVEMGWEVSQIIREINNRVDMIKKTEADLKAKEEARILKAKEEEEKRILKLKQDEEARILKAKEDEEARILYIEKQEEEKRLAATKEIREKAIQEERERLEIEKKAHIEEIKNKVVDVEFKEVEDQFYLNLEIVSNKDKLVLFKKFLLENEIEYKVLDQKRV